ncbi:MAG: lytic murein transglycosylase [Yoonia sp.]|jgi:lytic murein transglycosylase
MDYVFLNRVSVFMPKLCAAALTALTISTSANAATCGNDAGGFNQWKQQFSAEAAAAGVGQRGLQALAGTSYATRTISADRNQKSFRYSLEDFMRIRGADTIVAQGKRRISRDTAFFASLEAAYGVPASVIVAIHGMETGFGNFMGDANVISAISTLAYDCRRTEFFSGHAMAALQLVDRGSLSANTVGAMHGEIGHTQFLPGNVMRYGVDGDGSGTVDLTNLTDSLASTANFLRQKGWRPGAGYQQGQPNFTVIQEWNAAGVYQKAIAIMAGRIDS